MAIRAVVFDFGGVVIRTPFEMAPSLKRRLGLAPGSVDLAGPFDLAADPLWQRFRAGEFTELEYWHRQADRHAEMINAGEDRQRSLMDSLFDAPRDGVLRPDTWQLRRALIDRGLRVAALTNDLSRFHDPSWIERMDVLDKFDPFVDPRRRRRCSESCRPPRTRVS